MAKSNLIKKGITIIVGALITDGFLWAIKNITGSSTIIFLSLVLTVIYLLLNVSDVEEKVNYLLELLEEFGIYLPNF